MVSVLAATLAAAEEAESPVIVGTALFAAVTVRTH
jgi:hypothetical protein